MKKSIVFLQKVKSFFRSDNEIRTEKFVIAQKSCPHCASRGMFIFDSSAKTKNSKGQSNENKT